MIRKIKDVLLDFRQKYLLKKIRNKLSNKNFTIISDNCWGAHVYQDLYLKYNTPFLGMYIDFPDYIKLLNNLKYYLRQELKFVDVSKLEEVNIKRKYRKYPIGKLGDIELQMVHYKTKEEAKEKWDRRTRRVNHDNIFVKINLPENINETDLLKIKNIPYKNKIIFNKYERVGLTNEINFPKSSREANAMRKEMYMYPKYFDFVDWLNIGNEIFEK